MSSPLPSMDDENNNMSQSSPPSLKDICINTIIKCKYFTTMSEAHRVYNSVLIHLPEYEKLKKYLLNVFQKDFPRYLLEIGEEELESNFDAETFSFLKRQHEEQEKIKARFASLKGTIIERKEVKLELVSSREGFYPLEALLDGMAWPSDVDPTKREQHLHPEDFYAIFNMSKEEFKSLPKYKRDRIKKDKRLF
jgi:hypothetical protein